MNLRYQTIGEALEALATAHPRAPALHVPGRKSLTFQQLNEHTRYVHDQLIKWDTAPGDVIAGVIPSRPEMAVACAALPSSCTFAPLGSGLTTEGYSQLFTRMHAAAVLVPKDHDHCSRTAAQRVGIAEIEMASDPDAPAGLFTLRLSRNGHPPRNTSTTRPDFAYILTSSGTTGQPKLVPATHRQTLLYAKAACEWLEYSSRDVSCHLMPFHSGNGLRGLINRLLAGVSQVCLPEADVEAFFKALEQYPVTCLDAGFALHRVILRTLSSHPGAIRQSSFRFLRSGSGRLHGEEIDRLEQAFKAPVLVNLSSVETPISHDPLPPRRRKAGTAGVPFINEVATINDEAQLLPTNSPGEIIVRGPLVFSGYVDDPELTAASFQNGWFRTGDLGIIDEEGYIHVSGRLKEIINRGGEKISPAEIDMAIESLTQIREAAAFGVPHPSLGEEVVAAAVREAETPIDEPELIELIRHRVGPNKTPRKIYFVDRLPRNANGKVLRHKVAKMVEQHAKQDSSAADRSDIMLTPLQAAVGEIWTSLLQVGNFRADDNFFLVGGDSLHAVQLISRIKLLFGVELPIESLSVEAWTISGMAHAIESLRKGCAGTCADARLTTRDPLMHSPDIGCSKKPFFFFHGDLSGNALYWVKLASYLGEDRPLYPLQPAGMDGKAFPASIEEMAHRHLETIRSIQQQGPYFLGGYCKGGLVAFETARQLQQLGEKVDAIVLIEVSPKNRRRQHRLISCAARLLRLDTEQELDCYIRLPMFLTSFRKLSYSQRIQFLFKKLPKFKGAVSLLARLLIRRLGSPIPRSIVPLDRSDFVNCSPDQKLALHRRMMAAYVPYPYKGSIILFRCKDGPSSSSDPIMGWRDLATEVDLHEIPGDHVTCLTEHIEALAREIKSCLDRNLNAMGSVLSPGFREQTLYLETKVFRDRAERARDENAMPQRHLAV